MTVEETVELEMIEQATLRMVGGSDISNPMVKIVWLGILANRQLNPVFVTKAQKLPETQNKYLIIYERNN